MEALLTSKMPSEAPIYPTQPEKAHHYTYLKEFRTQQCPLFLQHKCTQHRPFTCFHWHFLNQRRRRPVRKRDGTFNYSPDAYCTRYDETTGICPDGEECALLHRTAGDTERRYHLRYYKTGNCVHETDSKGHCVKNGPHCAFAHGAHDLRQPVYDIRELASGEVACMAGAIMESSAATQLEKDRQANEDPKWNDTNYVLSNYKTEQCKRPPRLCRQGYACPSYHNSRDRRRSPKKHKYRSTPCPNVKHGDDWGDPAQCDSGDNCQYCHTRTEQQFHPEIYKSTKCNDMVQTGYCPRGPFCAFAHVERKSSKSSFDSITQSRNLSVAISQALRILKSEEMTTQRELSTSADNSLAAFVTNALPAHERDLDKENDAKLNGNGLDIERRRNSMGHMAAERYHHKDNGHKVGSLPEFRARHRSASGGSGIGTSLSTFIPEMFPQHYGKAPGSEREDNHHLRQQLQAIEDDISLDLVEKSKRRQNVLLMHGVNSTALQGLPNSPLSSLNHVMSPHATSFYPAGDTVESVIGNALGEDLDLGELSLSSIERDLAKENHNDADSVCSSYSAGFSTANNSYFGPSSMPVSIPGNANESSLPRNPLGSSLSQSPVSASPLGSLPNSLVHLQQHPKDQQVQEAAMAAWQPSSSASNKFPYPEYNSLGSPRNNNISQSPLLTSSFNGGLTNGIGELHRLQSELASNKAKMVQWEEGISQARSACEAWKREAEEYGRKMKIAEDDRIQAIKQRDEAVTQVAALTGEVERLRGGPFLHCLQRVSDVETLPVNIIKQMQAQLKVDLETLEKVASIRQTNGGPTSTSNGPTNKNH